MSVPVSFEQAIARYRSGDLDAADHAFEALQRLAPDDARIALHRGVVAHLRNDLRRAEQLVSQALRHEPQQAEAWLVRATIRRDAGQPFAAIADLEEFLRLRPGVPQALNDLGLLQQDIGRLDEAEVSLRRAIEIDPEYAAAHNNLGALLLQRDRVGEAIVALESAVRSTAGAYYEAHVNLAAARERNGQLKEAADSMARATALRPDDAEAWASLGHFLLSANRMGEAEISLRKAVELDPAGVRSLDLLAMVLANRGKTDEARDVFGRALALAPADARALLGHHLTLPTVYRDASHVIEERRRFSEGLAWLEASRALAAVPAESFFRDFHWNNFFLAYQGEDDRALQERFGALVAAQLARVAPERMRPLPGRWDGRRRLRVGFASGFFYRCTVGHYFERWVTGLDSSRFEIFVYALGAWQDDLTERLRQAASRSHVGFADALEASTRVAEDDLDVLIYPEVGMNASTFLMAGMRLAPVQCAAWGHPVTTGHPNIDVFLSSEAMEPEGAECHYAERLVRLPGLATSYRHVGVPLPGARAQFQLPEVAHLYLCPQSLFKVHPDNDELLVRVLERDPLGVLVMFQAEAPAMTEAFMRRLLGAFEGRGLRAEGRVRLLPMLPHEDYLRVNLLCDVMLDTVRWSGGNTSLDAIACGLPIVTLPGALMRGRQSMAMLNLMGLEQLVARTPDEYVDTAVRLGTDPSFNSATRQGIERSRGRLFDDSRPLRALEEALLTLAS